MRVFFVLAFISVFLLPYAHAQDTLPGFTASLKPNGKVLISWRNGYPAINQISIQRSPDSLRNFITLLTVPDPHIPENGFVDAKANGTKMYYRIFILFPDSKYMFTPSKRAAPETVAPVAAEAKPADKNKPVVKNPPVKKEVDKPVENSAKPPVSKSVSPAEQNVVTETKAPEEEKYLILPKIDNSRIYYMMDQNTKKPAVNSVGRIKAPTIEVEKYLFVKRRDTVIMRIAGTQVRRFSDSLVKQTKDTLVFADVDTLVIRPYVEIYKEPKEVYKISTYVFASKDGNITIALADWNRKKYFVAFYEMDSTQVLEVKDIHDPVLIIDKTNFGHSGWFRFELYEDGKLKEKNKLLIPRD